MEKPSIFTRVYFSSSAGQHCSGKGTLDAPLQRHGPLYEFNNHIKSYSEEATAFISVSDRIVDTRKRVFQKYHLDQEPVDEIWIVFIEVPGEADLELHSAQILAEEINHQTPFVFSHEFVFEGAIREQSVTHQVSLEVLMSRNVNWKAYDVGDIPSTAKVRARIAAGFDQMRYSHSPFDLGLRLGFFARAFGSRAPVQWISNQIFYDCVRQKILEEDVVRINRRHMEFSIMEFAIVDFEFFCSLDEGIKTALYEWWLGDPDFGITYEEFDEWRADEKSIIYQEKE